MEAVAVESVRKADMVSVASGFVTITSIGSPLN